MSPNTLYYKKVNKAKKDEHLLKEIEDIINIFPAIGYLETTKILKKTMKVGKNRVYRIMKINNLLNKKRPIKKDFSTDSKHKYFKFENLISNVKPTGITQIIVGDVTAFDIQGKDHYLALLMDVYNREIVGCAVSGKNVTNLVLSALENAYIRRGNLQGCIHHTDADVRYCSDKYVNRLQELGMRISMCVGNVYENAHAESLNGTIKREEINISEYTSLQEAAYSIFNYADKYNNIRPHSGINDHTPMEFIRIQKEIKNQLNLQKSNI